MARKERAYVLEIGMVQTHVHLLVRLHPMAAVSSLVKRLKGASSAVAAQEGLGTQGRLYWAKGYAVRSVSPQTIEAIRHYLRGQPSHHPSDAIIGWEGDRASEYDAAESMNRIVPALASRSDAVPSSDLSCESRAPSA